MPPAKERFGEILEKLSSENLEDLKLSDQVASLLLENENARASIPDSRLGFVLTMIGLITASIYFLLRDTDLTDENGIIRVVSCLFAGTILCVLKALYYSSRTISIGQAYVLDETLVYDICRRGGADAIRYSIASKLWVLQRLRQPNTKRIFFFSRAQKNVVISLAVLLLSIVVALVQGRVTYEVATSLRYTVYALILGTVMFLDSILDRFSFWNFDETNKE